MMINYPKQLNELIITLYIIFIIFRMYILYDPCRFPYYYYYNNNNLMFLELEKKPRSRAPDKRIFKLFQLSLRRTFYYN